VGNIAVTTKRCESFRIFDFRNGVRTVAKQAPALRETCNHMWPVFKPATTHDADRSMSCGEALQCLQNFVLAESVSERAAKRHVGLRRRQGILIAEKIRNERPISAAARRNSQCTARNGGDQDRFVTH